MKVLIHPKRGYVKRIYREGHEGLDAFDDEINEDFASILQWYGDSVANAMLWGDVRWMWMKCGRTGRATIKDKQFTGAIPVTMIRVHRKNTPRRKR